MNGSVRMNKYERAIYATRYQTIVKASAYIVRLNELDGHVLPQFIFEMESYRLPLLHMVAGNDLLSETAKYTLESLNAGIKWHKTRDKSDYKRMIQAYKQSDEEVEKVRREVRVWL